jgi:hypothetical protein
LAVLVAAMLLVPLVGAGAQPLRLDPQDGRLTLTGYEFIGTVNFLTGYTFAGTQVGGLSSITCDESRGVFYALSDDRSQTDRAADEDGPGAGQVSAERGGQPGCAQQPRV